MSEERVISGLSTATCSGCQQEIGQVVFETDTAGKLYAVNASELIRDHDCPKAIHQRVMGRSESVCGDVTGRWTYVVGQATCRRCLAAL